MVKFRNIEIKESDKLKVTICNGLEREGVVVFKDASYCLEYFDFGAYRTKPLTNYAPQCKFEKI